MSFVGSTFKRLNNIKVKWKIVGVIFVFNLLSISLVSTISFQRSKNALRSFSIQQMEGIRDSVTKQVERYFSELTIFSKQFTLDRVMEDVFIIGETAFYSAGFNIGNDENVVTNSFKNFDEKIGDRVRTIVNNYKMKSVYLVLNNGQIVYASDTPESNFFLGKNIDTGKALQETPIAKCFKESLNKAPGEMTFADFFSYGDNKTHGFICSKKVAEFDHPSEGITKGDSMGALITEIDLDLLDDITNGVKGMGETGINYLVADDKSYRSSKGKMSLHELMINKENAKGDGLDKALKGESGIADIKNGREHLRIYGPVHVWGQTWAIATEKDVDEILESANSMLKFIIIVSTILFIIMTIIGYFISNFLIKPLEILITEISRIVDASHDGNLKFRLDENKINLEFRPTFEGINKILDNIVNPLNEASAVLEEMGKGKLNKKVKGEYFGDFAKLKDSLNRGIESMSQVIRDVVGVAEKVANESVHVSKSSTELSTIAVKQASSLEEITSSMNEMGSQTKNNAENASAARTLTVEAKDEAETGNESMGKLNIAMGEIKGSSENISKIIKVIDEIAFQTNLLALNAAVEAARAGKHGKGFAVVAEEVRNLAQRSAEAAKETTDLIEDSNRKVTSGGQIAEDTGKALSIIVEKVLKVNTLIQEIADASDKQSLGLSQIIKGLEIIDQQTQLTASTSEESAQATKILSNEATELNNLVKKFTL